MTAFGGALTDPTKVVGSRVGAYIIDSILGLVLLLLFVVTVQAPRIRTLDFVSSFAAQDFCQKMNTPFQRFDDGGLRPDTGMRDQNEMCIPRGAKAYVLVGDELDRARLHLGLASMGFTIGNWVLLQSITGASVGKLVFGLRVVNERGQPAGVGRNLLRWIVLMVDGLCCGFLPGLPIAMNSKGHRRLGDMAAGTFVVHRSAMGRLLHIPGLIVVRRHDEFGGWGPAQALPDAPLGSGGGIKAPAWDESRNAYVRYDEASGVWFQWDAADEAWVPAQT